MTWCDWVKARLSCHLDKSIKFVARRVDGWTFVPALSDGDTWPVLALHRRH